MSSLLRSFVVPAVMNAFKGCLKVRNLAVAQ